MNDQEFLSYCQGMAMTPRCGFVPQQVARLIRLAGGDETEAQVWDARPVNVYNMDRYTISSLVDQARKRIKAEQEPLV